MPTRSRAVRDSAGRPPTAAELARRREILEATIAVIGRGGWAACTLQSVADEIGVTKAAVIYHVGTKAALVEQAYSYVIQQFAGVVQARVDAAGTPRDGVLAFAVAHLDYMRDHRNHARLIAESLNDAHPTGIEDRPDTPHRTQPAIRLIEAARAAGDAGAAHPEASVVVATMLNGMIDAAVGAWLQDDDFDLAAAERLVRDYIAAAV